MKVWKKSKFNRHLNKPTPLWKKLRATKNKPAKLVVSKADIVRERKKKAVGEVDLKDHVLMHCEVQSVKRGRKALSSVPVWVKITTGNRIRGQGIIDAELPEGFECHGYKLKLGDVVRFEHSLRKLKVIFTSKVRARNQLPELKADVLKDLQSRMTFNPAAKQEPDVVPAAKLEREVITVEQAAMKLAVTNMAMTQWLENDPRFTFVGVKPNKVWRPKNGAEIKEGYIAVMHVMENDEQVNALETEKATFEKDMASSRKQYLHWVNEFRVVYSLDLK